MVRALNCDFKSREFKSHYSPSYICECYKIKEVTKVYLNALHFNPNMIAYMYEKTEILNPQKNIIMNYKVKKYILQNKWLSQNLTKFDFFIIAHSKSCDSSKWVGFQKDLSKSNLKVKSLSFRNISKVELFSKLPNETIKNLFKGKNCDHI